jgi:hypothetical protein
MPMMATTIINSMSVKPFCNVLMDIAPLSEIGSSKEFNVAQGRRLPISAIAVPTVRRPIGKNVNSWT